MIDAMLPPVVTGRDVRVALLDWEFARAHSTPRSEPKGTAGVQQTTAATAASRASGSNTKAFFTGAAYRDTYGVKSRKIIELD